MQQIQKFISRRQEAFLEVGEHDIDDIRGEVFYDVLNLKIELSALKKIQFFPNVKRLILSPGILCPDDLHFLEGLEIEELLLEYDSDCEDEYTIDVGMFPNLRFLSARSEYDFCSANKCKHLVTLKVSHWNTCNLQSLSGAHIMALSIGSGKLKNLSGLESLSSLKSLSISYQRNLDSLAALNTCTQLESLEIENCNRLNFSDFPILPNLSFLALFGKRGVASLSFLDNFPRLDYCYLDIPIRDGDLSRLSGKKHCAIIQDRKNFSLQDSELPKSKDKFHSNCIPPKWEILPWC